MKPKSDVLGLNELDKRLIVRNQLRKWKVNIVRLQETKFAFIFHNIIRSLWGCNPVGWHHIMSRGVPDDMNNFVGNL